MTPTVSLREDRRLALELADAADEITTSRFGALDLRVDTKPDLTPVTDADTSVETVLRSLLHRSRPADSVLGEEYGGEATFTGRQWVIDPIDGTKNFARGVPIWATLIALLQDGVPVVGVVSAPALSRRWWAAEGLGAHSRVGPGEERSIHVSAVDQLSSASLSFSSLSGWADRGKRDRFIDLTDEIWRVRGFGDFSPTAWWQRVRSISPQNRRSRCGIWLRWTSSFAKRAAGSRIWPASPALTAAARWQPMGRCTTRCSRPCPSRLLPRYPASRRIQRV